MLSEEGSRGKETGENQYSPSFAAEEDIRFVRERREELENEKELMKTFQDGKLGPRHAVVTRDGYRRPRMKFTSPKWSRISFSASFRLHGTGMYVFICMYLILMIIISNQIYIYILYNNNNSIIHLPSLGQSPRSLAKGLIVIISSSTFVHCLFPSSRKT